MRRSIVLATLAAVAATGTAQGEMPRAPDQVRERTSSVISLRHEERGWSHNVWVRRIRPAVGSGYGHACVLSERFTPVPGSQPERRIRDVEGGCTYSGGRPMTLEGHDADLFRWRATTRAVAYTEVFREVQEWVVTEDFESWEVVERQELPPSRVTLRLRWHATEAVAKPVFPTGICSFFFVPFPCPPVQAGATRVGAVRGRIVLDGVDTVANLGGARPWISMWVQS